ncbi:transmembrane protein 107-like isoform X2 [Larus michahellis]|uniref:transmembrane protein 107-like isoform X2 n=1 Tax=Larus michahellis TaxID=119627 RepID=UPI003D9B3489
MPPRGLLVPARFLALTAHLVLLVLLVGDTDSPVRASLPPDFSAEEYARAQRCVPPAVTEALLLVSILGCRRRAL